VEPAYFDTSVLVKQYVAERGSRVAQSLVGRYRILSSALSLVELTSAATRRRVAQQIVHAEWERFLRNLQTDRVHWELLAVTDMVIARAEHVVRATGLRSLVALHVASALLGSPLSGRTLPFITADAPQRVGAEQLGLEVIWVE
jgi:predicted nucleic acid-binding protein